ncbi:ubiquinone/menaquinone biosynthesis methyltransferase [Roseibium album]|nr:ubiquinone/menaquinone biosynthesis methyltransferase [Roseibium album]
MLLTERYDQGAGKWTMALDRLGFPAAYRNLFAELDLNIRNKDICDVGTGCGDFVAALTQIGDPPNSLTLVDPSHKMLAQATNRLQFACRNLHSNARRLESLRGVGEFDIMLGAHVLEHLREPEEGLRKMFRLLRPGGRLVLSVSKPHVCQWFIWLKWRHRWFSYQQITELLNWAGFTAISASDFPCGVPARCSRAYVAARPLNS